MAEKDYNTNEHHKLMGTHLNSFFNDALLKSKRSTGCKDDNIIRVFFLSKQMIFPYSFITRKLCIQHYLLKCNCCPIAVHQDNRQGLVMEN